MNPSNWNKGFFGNDVVVQKTDSTPPTGPMDPSRWDKDYLGYKPGDGVSDVTLGGESVVFNGEAVTW